MPRPKGAYASRNQTVKRCRYGSFRDGDRLRCLRNPKHNQRVNRQGRRVVAAPAARAAQRRVVVPPPVARRSARIAARN